MPHVFTITNPPIHSLLCRILLLCLTSKSLFFKHSFLISIHLFCSLPIKQLYTSIHSYIDPLSNPVILHTLHMAEPSENTFINFVILTPHNCLIHAFTTLCILLILSKPLKFSICIALILDLYFSIHIIVSLPYVRKGTRNYSCKTTTIKLQTPSINQRPNSNCYNPPIRHLPTTFFLIST